MKRKRKDNEAPEAISEWGWRFHHIGIPTNAKIKNERYLETYRIGVGGFESSPFGVEWMRFEKDCQVPLIIQKIPHIAFEVDDIEKEFKRKNFHVITQPNSPSEGVKVVMIEYEGAPIELIEFNKK